MIAKISIDETSILEEMLSCPYSLKYLASNGRQPSNPELRGAHADGCGMAFSKDGQIEVHKRSRENAWNKSYCDLARTSTSNIFLAHNRLASQGLNISAETSHPFSVSAAGKTFALCHNGSVQSFMEEANTSQTSDSKIFLSRLIDKQGQNDADAIFSRLTSIARTQEYTSLCCFLISSDELFVWRIYSERDHAKIAAYEKYYTVYFKLHDRSAVFASEPLDDGPWMLLDNNSFLQITSGKKNLSIMYRKV